MGEKNKMKRLFNTFGNQRSITAARKLSESRYSALLTQCKTLRESGRTSGRYNAALLDEAVKLERLIILEAMSKLDPEETVEQARGMMDAVQGLCDTLGAHGLNEKANDVFKTLMSAYGSASAADKGAMSKYAKSFTDLGVIVKGLLALADEARSSNGSTKGGGSGGGVADTLRTALSLPGGEEQPLESLMAGTDKETGSTAKKKPGLLKRIMGDDAGQGMAGRFADAVKKCVAGASPGFSKIVNMDEFCDDLVQNQVPEIVMAFSYFSDKAMKSVSDDFLTGMTKKGVWQGLKDMVGGMFGGGGGTSASGAMSPAPRL